MSEIIDYAAFIRLPDGSLNILEASSKMDSTEGMAIRYDTFKLTAADFKTVLGTLVHKVDLVPTAEQNPVITENTMPAWFKLPSAQAENKLINAYKPEDGPIQVTNNVTTFSVYRRNGAMMGQFRHFVSSAGNPILDPGMPGMHGGMIESIDFPPDDGSTEDAYAFARMSATWREVLEEFGIRINFGDIIHLGDVYDADNRRFNHVHRIAVPYETALVQTHGTNVHGIMQAILNCEGLGRMSNMFKPDLDRAIEIGALTPITIAILQAFPELFPPEKPLN